MPEIVTLTLNPAVDISTSTPRVESVHKLRCDAPQVHPGGGGVNVARVVHRLGADVLGVFPSGGMTGQRLQQLLAAEKVPTHSIAIARETRESFHVHEGASGQDFRFVLPGPALEREEWLSCLVSVTALMPAPRHVVASGSLPPGVPTDFYAQLARQVHAHGSKLVLDASGPALAAALQEGGIFLIKPSLRELSELTGEVLGDDDSRIAACRRIVSAGRAEVVALSLGDQGALVVTADAALRAPALRVQVASTVGAGDSFVGGLLWALNAGEPLETALRYAMATSAAALLSAGTALAEPEDVQKLLPQVNISRC